MNVISLFLIVASAIYVINIPFGYWRKNVSKKSLQWFLAIHIPIPFIFVLRTIAGFGLETIPLFAIFFFMGQLTGGKIREKIGEKIDATSCLIMDLMSIIKLPSKDFKND